MSQFEIVEELFAAQKPLTLRELNDRIELHPSTVKAHLDLCIKKGNVVETDSGYQVPSDFDESDLEKLRPSTLGELMGDQNEE